MIKRIFDWAAVMTVVDKTVVTATSPIRLIPLMLAAFGEMSQTVLVTVTPVLSTTLYSP